MQKKKIYVIQSVLKVSFVVYTYVIQLCGIFFNKYFMAFFLINTLWHLFYQI